MRGQQIVHRLSAAFVGESSIAHPGFVIGKPGFFQRVPLEAVTKAMAKESIAPLVSAYRRSIDLAAGRAGLLASGDLSLALRMTERFPQHGAATREEQHADLLTYSVGAEYLTLRERLGVAAHG